MTGQQLKNSILQMAVQGKLVPQDHNDEPASVLLERIRKEKEQLIKEGKIKKEKNPSVIFRGADNLPYEKVGKNEPVCIADEVPFDIPESWEWIRLGTICDIARGGSPRPIKSYLTDSENGINWIKISDSDKGGKYINSTKEKIIPEGVAKSRMVYAGDFLLTNSMSFGRPYILNVDGCIHDGWLVLSNYQTAYDQDFLFTMLSSNFAYYQFCSVVSGAVVKNLNSEKVADSLFPLPPIQEQKRIVSAINSFEPLISEYTTCETELNNLNRTFPDRLKKSILQEAVQGKLVSQYPNDEPASVLLERIRAEKQRLIKEGKIKKDKHESVIFRRDNSHYEKLDGIERCIDNEIPFEIPDSWEWVRLGTLFQHNTGKALNSSNSTGRKLSYITTSNLYWDRFELEKLKEMPFTENEIEKCTVTRGDLLVCEGGDIGRAAIWKYDYPIRIQNHIHRLRPYTNISIRFYYYIFYLYKNIGLIGGKGIGIQGLSSNAIHQLLFPLPPLQEQNKIVAAIESLIPYCERL